MTATTTAATPRRRALFLDRDGTIIRDAHYLNDPARLELIAGAAEAIRRANAAGVPVFVITNQSGIARGLITPEQYTATEARLRDVLDEEGAFVDATFHCPHAADTDPSCRCRKPGLGMYEDAAQRFGLELSGSVYAGDRWKDVQPALEAKGIGVLIPGVETAAEDIARARTLRDESVRIVSDLAAAVDIAIGAIAPDALVRPACRIAVLASGSGSNVQALIDHFQRPTIDAADIVLVASNRTDAGALARARDAGIDTAHIADPTDADEMAATLDDARVDLVALAGYLKQVPAKLVRRYHGRMLNVHPALLPSYGGVGMYGARVHRAVLDGGNALTGVTVHFVDDNYDRGPIIAQWPVAVRADDDVTSLSERVLAAEHAVYPRCVQAVAQGVVSLGADGRVVGVVPGLAPDFTQLLR